MTDTIHAVAHREPQRALCVAVLAVALDDARRGDSDASAWLAQVAPDEDTKILQKRLVNNE